MKALYCGVFLPHGHLTDAIFTDIIMLNLNRCLVRNQEAHDI